MSQSEAYISAYTGAEIDASVGWYKAKNLGYLCPFTFYAKEDFFDPSALKNKIYTVYGVVYTKQLLTVCPDLLTNPENYALWRLTPAYGMYKGARKRWYGLISGPAFGWTANQRYPRLDTAYGMDGIVDIANPTSNFGPLPTDCSRSKYFERWAQTKKGRMCLFIGSPCVYMVDGYDVQSEPMYSDAVYTNIHPRDSDDSFAVALFRKLDPTKPNYKEVKTDPYGTTIYELDRSNYVRVSTIACFFDYTGYYGDEGSRKKTRRTVTKVYIG